MLKFLFAIAGASCFPAILLASDDYVREGVWQSFLGKDGCVVWSVAESEPNAQIHFRHREGLGVSVDLSAAAWHDTGTPIQAGAGGFAEVLFFDVPIENVARAEVVPAGHAASLIEKHRPEQLKQVRDLLDQIAADEGDFGIVYGENVPHGRFSTVGYASLIEKFDACIAGQ